MQGRIIQSVMVHSDKVWGATTYTGQFVLEIFLIEEGSGLPGSPLSALPPHPSSGSAPCVAGLCPMSNKHHNVLVGVKCHSEIAGPPGTAGQTQPIQGVMKGHH